MGRALAWLFGGLVLFAGALVLLDVGPVAGGILSTILVPVLLALVVAVLVWDARRRQGRALDELPSPRRTTDG